MSLLLFIATALYSRNLVLGESCVCSYPEAKYCTALGRCDAAVDGAHLQTYAASTTAFRSPDARRASPDVWRGVCSDLADPTHSAYFVVEEFTDWEPACARVGTLQTCTLAPPGLDSAFLPMEQLNAKISAFFDLLGCRDAGLAPHLVQGDWRLCRGELCNHNEHYELAQPALSLRPPNSTVHRNSSVPAAPRSAPQTVVVAAGESELISTLLYIVLPILITLLVLAAVSALICWRCSLWSFVYRLQDKEASRLDSLYESV